MSGLWCMGNGDFTKYRIRNSTIKDKYFKKYDSISTEYVKNVFKELPYDTIDKDMLKVNDIRITDEEKDVAYTEGLFGNCKSQRQNANDDDDFEHHVIHQSKLMITA
ncbi:hypothetical protein Adt_06716 [Abeliophyllum distichum]|uniref:Uncharacterized protein n=1 Tax=Abeliophyllum distichum TaxID=126358 RepID=A0ABD1V7Q1_9LAMI